MQARGALAKPTARSSLTNVFGFFIGFWERRRYECHLTRDVKLRARYIVGWNRPWVSIFVTCQRPQARQEASRSQAHQSLAQPTRSLRNGGAVF
jgi:hypothetical protein